MVFISWRLVPQVVAFWQLGWLPLGSCPQPQGGGSWLPPSSPSLATGTTPSWWPLGHPKEVPFGTFFGYLVTAVIYYQATLLPFVSWPIKGYQSALQYKIDTWSFDSLTSDFSKQPPKLPYYIVDFWLWLWLFFDFLQFFIGIKITFPHGGHGPIIDKKRLFCVVQAHKTFVFVLTIASTLDVGLAHKTSIHSSCLLPTSQSSVVSIPSSWLLSWLTRLLYVRLDYCLGLTGLVRLSKVPGKHRVAT